MHFYLVYVSFVPLVVTGNNSHASQLTDLDCKILVGTADEHGIERNFQCLTEPFYDSSIEGAVENQ